MIKDVRQGRYVFKLLAVDVPSAAGPEQRIYLEGDERIYNRGSVMRELRDPFLNVRSVPLGATTELLPSILQFDRAGSWLFWACQLKCSGWLSGKSHKKLKDVASFVTTPYLVRLEARVQGC